MTYNVFGGTLNLAIYLENGLQIRPVNGWFSLHQSRARVSSG